MKDFFRPLHIIRLFLLIAGIVFLFFAFVKRNGSRNNTFLILGLILGAIANIMGALNIE